MNSNNNRNNRNKNRVVITGIGPVTSIARGVDEFFTAVNSLKTAFEPIPSSYEMGKKYRFKSRFYVKAPEPKLEQYGLPRTLEKILDKASLLAVEASYLAIKDSALPFKVVTDMKDRERGKALEFEGDSNIACILGVGVSSMAACMKAHEASVLGEVENSWRDESNATDEEKELNKQELKIIKKYGKELGVAEKFNRVTAFQVMANASSAWVSILFGLKGETYNLNTACASGTYAICRAVELIRNGNCQVALCGGVECLEDKFGAPMRSFDMLGALSATTDGNPRPFSDRRSGFLFADGGACVLVVESLEHAQQRNAKIYAEIVDYKINSDAYGIVQMDSSGENIRSIISEFKNKAEEDSEKIDYINAHGTATYLNDQIESEVVASIFGGDGVKVSEQPLINSTKGILGHTIAASGAIEAAVTALAIKNSIVHGSLIERSFSTINVPIETVKRDIKWAMSMSYGFGGHNSGILFKKYQGK
ncbi:MAG: beta-ketoacyl-[acyl-carrier-protein] synthase family protein [Oligoflexia bacterium]|nr:beta-ketoacyl-[acyl-carrier-protein] synthase family protein [Oligoflexia bacterium]